MGLDCEESLSYKKLVQEQACGRKNVYRMCKESHIGKMLWFGFHFFLQALYRMMLEWQSPCDRIAALICK